jgi:ribosomal protein S27AE
VALQETRNVCLTCHVDMANHRAGRECAACHEVRWLAERRPGR